MYKIHLLSLLIVITACQSNDQPSSSEQEEWISMFNGVDLSGWDIKIAGYELNDNYKETFGVEDSMIRVKYDNYEEFNDAFGHLYYETPYSYYRMKFDYRFVGDQLKGGASWNVRNSGIMYHSQSASSNEINQGFPVSIELQLLGGLGEGERSTGNVCTPGTAVMMGDTVNYNHCVSSSSPTYHGDQWISAEAIILGGEAMHFLIAGDTVLSFQKPLVGGAFISEERNGTDWDEFGIIRDREDWIFKANTVLTEGYIALQAESHPIDFKNLKLLDLCGCMDPKAKNYKSYYLKDKPNSCQY